MILHGTSTTRNALDATQTITSRWAQFRRDGFFNPMSFQQKHDACEEKVSVPERLAVTFQVGQCKNESDNRKR